MSPRDRRPILTLPDERLRSPSLSVKLPDRQLRRLVDEMVVTMRLANGIGLAAPQIGEPYRLAVVEVANQLFVLGNPTIVRQGAPLIDWEGCLSIPDRVAKVARASEIVIAADDIEGRHVRYRGRGLLARAFQHEIDHLAGRLYTDLVEPDEVVDTREHPERPRAEASARAEQPAQRPRAPPRRRAASPRGTPGTAPRRGHRRGERLVLRERRVLQPQAVDHERAGRPVEPRVHPGDQPVAPQDRHRVRPPAALVDRACRSPTCTRSRRRSSPGRAR